MDSMDVVAEDATLVNPELVLLLALIDSTLAECASRSLVSADEMADHLLDIRAAALALRR